MVLNILFSLFDSLGDNIRLFCKNVLHAYCMPNTFLGSGDIAVSIKILFLWGFGGESK